jgi:hypothetical protein
VKNGQLFSPEVMPPIWPTKPVVASNSFGPGSIAVYVDGDDALVEQGRLDLNADVNFY